MLVSIGSALLLLGLVLFLIKMIFRLLGVFIIAGLVMLLIGVIAGRRWR